MIQWTTNTLICCVKSYVVAQTENITRYKYLTFIIRNLLILRRLSWLKMTFFLIGCLSACVLHFLGRSKKRSIVHLGGINQILISSAVNFVATRKSFFTAKKKKKKEVNHRRRRVFIPAPAWICKESKAAWGQVQGQGDTAWEIKLSYPSLLQLFVPTEECSRQSWAVWLYQMAAWFGSLYTKTDLC